MSEFYNNLKTLVLGTRTSDIDNTIDASMQSIGVLSSKLSTNKYLETIKTLITQTGVDPTADMMKSFQPSQQVQLYDQTGRVNRYVEYDSIINKISYCQRALTTLTDHILSPDEITKKSLVFTTDEEDDKNSLKNVIARCKEIEKKILMENKLNKIIYNTLKKGDYFTEILHSPRGQNALTILHEDKEVDSNDFKNLKQDKPIPIHEDVTIIKAESKDEPEKMVFKGNVILEYAPFGGPFTGMGSDTWGSNITGGGVSGKAITYKDNKLPPTKSKDQNPTGSKDDDPDFKSKYSDDKEAKKDSDKFKLKDIFLTVHNPKFIIRLETERFRSCLGYLVFPKIDPSMMNAATSFNFSSNSVDSICMNIVNRLHDTLKSSNDKIVLSKDLKDSVMNYLKVLKNNEDLRIRYVPPELMIHWRLNTDRYDPYGESIFECVNFDCRLLMALKTANTIKKLTGATDKRVVYVETGLPRDAKNTIESLKESLNKKKMAIGTMGSIDTIPSQISTFETVYIPMRDGKKFVEIEKQEWGADANQDTEMLKFIRDNIVANLGVPAPYLGLEENMSNRSLLSTENINFCRTIISYQKELTVFLRETFEKVYRLLFNDDELSELDKIKITFQEPKISPYEHEMEYVETMQRLIEALRSLDVPMSWLKKKYLPTINWDEVEKFKAEETIKKELSEAQPDEQNNNMMGGATGGMTGGGMY